MRPISVIWVILIVCAASLLYSVKYQVQEMDQEIHSLRAQIRNEKKALHVLSAEWSYQSRPERLSMLVKKHLTVTPVASTQMADVAEIPFPQEEEVQIVDGSKGTLVTEPKLRPGVVRTGGADYVR